MRGPYVFYQKEVNYMQRIVEPELMDDLEQAEAYANADFEQSDNLFIELFDDYFCHSQMKGTILDLGCGPGNISFKFAKHYPDAKVIGIDGSAEMIQLANQKLNKMQLNHRINFITRLIPNTELATMEYAAIVSNSLLHHLHQPEVLWQTIKHYASANTKIFIVDLFRPATTEKALETVNQYASMEPEILQRDFYNSLLAAFHL